MKDIFDIDFRESIRRTVKKSLKEDYGIKLPKEKSMKQAGQDENQENGGVFGIPLENVPSINTDENSFNPVPRFLVDVINFLHCHLSTEGLFRKSGSLGRQKLLRNRINAGMCCDYQTAQPHDMASLLKQFFRELPDPLFTNGLYNGFLKALLLGSENEKNSAILLLCLLLPDENLRVLRYVSRFIHKLSQHSNETKMSLSNLAIVLTPNIMFSTKDKCNDKCLKEQTQVVDCVFQNANMIGFVPDHILEKLDDSENEALGSVSSSGDELEGNERPGRTRSRSRRHRRRSRSISGFVMGLGKKIRQQNSRTSQDDGDSKIRHQRSKSEKSITTMRPDSALYTSTPERGDNERLDSLNLFSEQPITRQTRSRSLKRKPDDQYALSFHLKSPKVPPRQPIAQTITSPKLVTMSTQYMMTPRRKLQSVKNVDQQAPSPMRALPPLDIQRLNSLQGHKTDTNWRSFTNTPTNQSSLSDCTVSREALSNKNKDESCFNTPECNESTTKQHIHRKPPTPYSITPCIDFRNIKQWKENMQDQSTSKDGTPPIGQQFNPICSETIDY